MCATEPEQVGHDEFPRTLLAHGSLELLAATAWRVKSEVTWLLSRTRRLQVQETGAASCILTAEEHCSAANKSGQEGAAAREKEDYNHLHICQFAGAPVNDHENKFRNYQYKIYY